MTQNTKANTAAFKKKYPFLDVHAQQSRGTDSARLLWKSKAGWLKMGCCAGLRGLLQRVSPVPLESGYLDMAKKGVLQIRR